MKLEFFSKETIPTRLRLKVDDKYYVNYEEAPYKYGCFGYKFSFFDGLRDNYLEVLNEIVKTMEQQSYDHDAWWEETEREIQCVDEDRPYYHIEAIVYFRWHDTY